MRLSFSLSPSQKNPISMDCASKLSQLHFCAQCQHRDVSVKPCRTTCTAVMSHCLNYTHRLDPDFLSSFGELVNSSLPNVNSYQVTILLQAALKIVLWRLFFRLVCAPSRVISLSHLTLTTTPVSPPLLLSRQRRREREGRRRKTEIGNLSSSSSLRLIARRLRRR